MKKRSIPRTNPEVIHLATKAIAGALSVGIEIALKQNDAPKLTQRLHDLIGDPGVAPNGGKLSQLHVARAEVGVAQFSRQQVVADGRRFCGNAVDVLKPFLGRSWNVRWEAAGFSRGSLALSEDPLPMLLALRGYFRAHPEHENASAPVTAAAADSLATAIREADTRVEQARSERITARKERDVAIKALRRTLTGLRTELDQLLGPDDERWLQFGFSRPNDGRMPGIVSGLSVRAGVATEVHVEWASAPLADNYRVTRQVRGVDTAPVEVGLFADRAAVIRGLPSGTTVEIGVTARNQVGETAPTIVVIVVP